MINGLEEGLQGIRQEGISELMTADTQISEIMKTNPQCFMFISGNSNVQFFVEIHV